MKPQREGRSKIQTRPCFKLKPQILTPELATPMTTENPRMLSSLTGLAIIQISSRNWKKAETVEVAKGKSRADQIILTLTNLAFYIKQIKVRELNHLNQMF